MTSERTLTRRVVQVMGMPISLAIGGRHAYSEDGRRAWECVVESLRDTDRVFSTYRDDSWISRLDRDEVTLAECPPEVLEVFAHAEQATAVSRGAFDIRFPGQDGRMRLDPSGIVKGWAVDRAATHLRSLEDTDFCLSAGGDMVCSVSDVSSPVWRIGIEDPLDPAQVLAAIPLENAAIATSGPTHRGAHIVDPRTGRTPAVWASVSVVASTLVEADVDATSAFVLGERAPEWIATRAGRSALFVRHDKTMEAVGFGSPGHSLHA